MILTSAKPLRWNGMRNVRIGPLASKYKLPSRELYLSRERPLCTNSDTLCAAAMMTRHATRRYSLRREALLFDHLVGGDKQRCRAGKPDCQCIASKRLGSPCRSGRSSFGRVKNRKTTAVTRELQHARQSRIRHLCDLNLQLPAAGPK